jgi:hypothetical protein
MKKYFLKSLKKKIEKEFHTHECSIGFQLKDQTEKETWDLLNEKASWNVYDMITENIFHNIHEQLYQERIIRNKSKGLGNKTFSRYA